MVCCFCHPLAHASNPFVFNTPLSSLSSLSFAARIVRLARVSRPWIVFAIAQRFRPCLVFGPVDFPPWNRHTCFPLLAGAIHCCFVRFDVAWHRGQRIRLPRVMRRGCFSQELMSGKPLLNCWSCGCHHCH